MTTIKCGGGARKNTRAHESEEHTSAILALTASLNGWRRVSACRLGVIDLRGVEEGGEEGEEAAGEKLCVRTLGRIRSEDKERGVGSGEAAGEGSAGWAEVEPWGRCGGYQAK